MVLYAEDLQPGQQIQLGSHTVTEAEILEFGRQWDPLVMHTDPAGAAKMPIGGVIASGLHTFAVYQRLAVAAFWKDFNGGIGRGFELHFRRPVRPDTILTGTLTIRTIEPRDDGRLADMSMDAELTDQDGTVVISLTNYTLIPCRAAEDPSPASP